MLSLHNSIITHHQNRAEIPGNVSQSLELETPNKQKDTQGQGLKGLWDSHIQVPALIWMGDCFLVEHPLAALIPPVPFSLVPPIDIPVCFEDLLSRCIQELLAARLLC